MEQNQNKFIPHENKTQIKSQAISILFVFALGLFIVSLVVFGISYFTKTSLAGQLVAYKEGLDRSKERFNEGLPIRTIEEFDKRLRASRDVLSKHKSFTGLFGLIERITLSNVQFISFSYSEVDNTRKNVVRMIGRATDYKTIAEQSEQFSLDEEARRYITDVVFSNLSVDSKNSDLITFEVMFVVDPEFLLYNRYVSNNDSPAINTISSPRTNTPNIVNQ